MMGRFAAAFIATSVAMSSVAIAGEKGNQAALAKGAPAGIKQAQSFDGNRAGLLLAGGAVVIAGIVLVATGNGHGSVPSTCPLAGCTPPTTTTTTATTTTTSTGH